MRYWKKDFFLLFLLWAVLLQLPRGAVVLQEDESGKTWRQSGEMSCAFPLALTQWDSRLRYQGWRCQDRIPMERGRSLTVWQKGDQQITVFLWQIKIGQTGFAWGERNSAEAE